MKTARIRRPTPQNPNVASRADTLNDWLVEYHHFDLSRPYSCREERNVKADGSFAIELVYEQDEGGPTHAELAARERREPKA